jgi:Glu-tRNA(Gln) amidotransferase subunit E-like FAD-binding protein
MRDYWNDHPEQDDSIAQEDEAIWELLESAGVEDEVIQKVSAVVNGLLEEISRLKNAHESEYTPPSPPSSRELLEKAIAACDAGDEMMPSAYQTNYDEAYAAWEARRECAERIRALLPQEPKEEQS